MNFSYNLKYIYNFANYLFSIIKLFYQFFYRVYSADNFFHDTNLRHKLSYIIKYLSIDSKITFKVFYNFIKKSRYKYTHFKIHFFLLNTYLYSIGKSF